MGATTSQAFGQVNVRYTFGRYVPPGIPFSDNDTEKIQAQIIQTTTVPLDDYPVGYEMVFARVDWSAPANASETTLEIRWIYLDTMKTLGATSYAVPAGLTLGHAGTWLGRGPGGINQLGKYAVDFIAPGLFTNRITFQVTANGIVTAQLMPFVDAIVIFVVVFSGSIVVLVAYARRHRHGSEG